MLSIRPSHNADDVKAENKVSREKESCTNKKSWDDSSSTQRQSHHEYEQS